MENEGAPQNRVPLNEPQQRLSTPFDTATTAVSLEPTGELPANNLGPPDNEYVVYTRPSRWSWLRKVGLVVLILGIVVSVGLLVLRRGDRNAPLAVGDFSAVRLPLGKIFTESPSSVSGQALQVNGVLHANSSVVIAPSSQPTAPAAGELYYDQTLNQLSYYNGTQFVNVGSSSSLVQNTLNNVTSNVFNTAAGATNITNTTNTTVGGTGNVTTPGGTTNVLPKFSGGQSLGDSIVTDNGSNITVNGNVNLLSPAASGEELTIFAPASLPTTPSNPFDTQAQELGVKFRSDLNGIVKGIRFYKGALNTGTHIGSLWTSGGVKLATATFTGETATGWQEVRFATPVSVAADTTYIASYHTDVGGYAFDASYFALNGVDNGPLHALQDGVDGGNGVFRVSATSAFPTGTFNANQYWVDLVFTPSQSPAQYQIDGAVISSLNLSNNGDLAKRSSGQVFTGYNTFRSGVNASKAFSIQASDTTTLFQADTSALQISIGNPFGDATPVLLVLANKSTADDPFGIEGSMYYNSTTRSFRCYKGSSWGDCGIPTIDHGFTSYDEFLGGQAGTLANGDIGELGWNAVAIGANGALSFNPTTPTPTANRPGVLALQTPAVNNQGSTLLLGNAAGGSMLIAKDNGLKAAVAVGATTGQVLRIGLHTETSATTQPVSGVWFEANPATSANWLRCYGDGTTPTCIATGTAIAANSWVSLEIRVTATGTGTSSATFVIDGTSSSFTAVTIDTTNRVSPAYSCYATAAAAQNCYWDYFQLRGTTSAAR